ncbi:competence protein [Streptococcus pneumoniae]|nr:competence protein [Streptococcus pneumoniae]CKD23581.1 competence protein [Streptococcus pneumoniae]COB81646.1 competence protein [Streptococcus pneumoniae]COL60934.1 competence protein [Streptococcus pneumoniae]COM38235.1 competence protein [Streptococcus pneumoniae]
MEAIIEKIKEYKIIVICTGLGLLVGGFFLLKPAPQTPVKETNLQAEVAAVSKDLVSEKEVNKEEKEEPVEQDLITVDVKGAVKSPGIYDLPVGSRVNDAVQKAGGLTEQADSKSLNLAQKVSDEALVYVPISVGKSNRMKLPHQETLTRLEGINSKVYRTDQQGAIRFKGLDSWKIESVR